jgi:hypothetical protein
MHACIYGGEYYSMLQCCSLDLVFGETIIMWKISKTADIIAGRCGGSRLMRFAIKQQAAARNFGLVQCNFIACNASLYFLYTRTLFILAT